MKTIDTLKFPNELEIYNAINQGGYINYGGNMRFTHCEGTLNVFISDRLEYSGDFCIAEINEALSLLKYYLQAI